MESEDERFVFVADEDGSISRLEIGVGEQRNRFDRIPASRCRDTAIAPLAALDVDNCPHGVNPGQGAAVLRPRKLADVSGGGTRERSRDSVGHGNRNFRQTAPIG
jgi:hypothetical protein